MLGCEAFVKVREGGSDIAPVEPHGTLARCFSRAAPEFCALREVHYSVGHFFRITGLDKKTVLAVRDYFFQGATFEGHNGEP